MENFKRIPVTDRATMAGILLAILDFEKDAATFRDYDRMTGHELCIRAGLSKRLVDDFVRPTLAVGLFAPLEQTSAAVMLELLYFYALAHQAREGLEPASCCLIQLSAPCALKQD